MSTLVTLDEAKLQTNVRSDDHDESLQLYLDIAEEVVIDHVNQRLQDEDGVWAATVAAWTSETVPERVRGAILLLTADLWGHRGDDEDPRREYGRLPQRVIALLQPLRDPTLA